MKFSLLTLILCLGTLTMNAQDRGFIVKGHVNIPDGYEVGICCETDTSMAVTVAESTIKDGEFVLTGKLDRPYISTLITNNQALVAKNNWPIDSIQWTYTDMFLDNEDIIVDKNLNIVGGEAAKDFNTYEHMNGDDKDWTFITAYPSSKLSVILANNLLKRGYNLTAEQVDYLEKTILAGAPNDPTRMEEFKQRIAYAKKTTKGGKLVDLELKDTKGKVKSLLKVIPKNKFVLVDFWASWCGICIAAMPEVRKIAEEYPDKFAVIGVSIDKKEDAWRKAMDKHPEPWPQYVTTEKGYEDLFHKYQVGNGVPYYLMITPDGKVLNSPSEPEAVREILEKYQ